MAVEPLRILTIAVAEIHHQMLGQVKFRQRFASGGNIFCMVIRFFTATHNDMSERVAAGLVDGHLAVFIRGEEHMAGA